MTPEQEILNRFLELSIETLENTLKEIKPEFGNIDEEIEYEKQKKMLDTLKKEINKLKKD